MIQINGHHVKPTIFPDGTSQIWHLPEEILRSNSVVVDWRFESEREIMDLFSINALCPQFSELYMPYLPYGRQDKPIGNDATFNLRAFSYLINRLGLQTVSTIDAHNPTETAKLIRNFHNKPIDPIHQRVILEVKPDLLVFPDSGACERYLGDLGADFGGEFVSFDKVRDQATGVITGHEVSNGREYIADNQRFLIIDDLVDGGATFISIAHKLKELVKNPDIHLFVTHGIFSRGREHLTKEGIKLYTTNSLPRNADGYEV